MILSTAAIYSWNMRSKMDVRDYFIQKWQIYSKWYANSSCFSLPRVCAEKNRGSIRLSGESTMIDSLCLLKAARPGAFPSQLSSLPPFVQMGKLMLRDLRVAHRHTAWYWQSHGNFSPLLTLYLMLSALPWSFSWSPHGKPARLAH